MISTVTIRGALITIQKAVDAGSKLRSKKPLIENFIAGINDVTDVMAEWRSYVAKEKERQREALCRAFFGSG